MAIVTSEMDTIAIERYQKVTELAISVDFI